MDLIMEIPKNIKHYDFKKVIIENIVENYDTFMEDCRVKSLHSNFLNKYKLDNIINWYF